MATVSDSAPAVNGNPARAIRPRPRDVCRLVVVIRGEPYTCRPISTAPGLAWRLRKQSDGSTYNVSNLDCECPDFQWKHAGREGSPGCKHQRALRALGLLPPADAAVEDDPTDPDNGDPRDWPEWTDRGTYSTAR